MIFKWVFKSAAAILIVTNTWNIVMGVFDMAQSVVAQAAGIIGSDASIDISSVMTDLEPRLMEMDLGPTAFSREEGAPGWNPSCRPVLTP